MEYRITGTVVNGNKIGRRIGFPTANVAVGEQEALRNGVYAARVEVDGRTYDAVANLGHKPTIGSGLKRTLEAYLFGFEGDLYGRTINVELLAFIRIERRFDSIDELRGQIERDKQDALRYFETGENASLLPPDISL